ncbi:Uncharacterized protein DBV15_01119 [Temnothorax longispinosus]|uniref:Uncharacterized protein n=1 Tax=Temnothorax longispinosus TaxID=300112 RepID=A0A4S2JAT4_9HYME|nr:Uncharacterized protein DBV15_01119 [Temnothorax longispinosus]
MPVRYLHGTPRTDSTHSAGAAFTHPRTCVQRAVSSPFLPSLPYIFRTCTRPGPWDTKESVSLRSRAIRDVTMRVTSLPEYPAQAVRRKLAAEEFLSSSPSSAFLSPWRFYGNGARTKSSGISGETKLLVDEGGSERDGDR